MKRPFYEHALIGEICPMPETIFTEVFGEIQPPLMV